MSFMALKFMSHCWRRAILGQPRSPWWIFCRTSFWCVTFVHLRLIIIIIIIIIIRVWILCFLVATLCNIVCSCKQVNWLRVRDLSSFKGSAINIRHPHCFIFRKPCLCCSILYVIFALRHDCFNCFKLQLLTQPLLSLVAVNVKIWMKRWWVKWGGFIALTAVIRGLVFACLCDKCVQTRLMVTCGGWGRELECLKNRNLVSFFSN